MNVHVLNTVFLVLGPMLAVLLLPDDLPLMGVPHAAAIGLGLGLVVFALNKRCGDKQGQPR